MDLPVWGRVQFFQAPMVLIFIVIPQGYECEYPMRNGDPFQIFKLFFVEYSEMVRDVVALRAKPQKTVLQGQKTKQP